MANADALLKADRAMYYKELRTWHGPTFEASVSAAIDALDHMTDTERMAVFSQYCTHCGCTDSNCPCWNDE